MKFIANKSSGLNSDNSVLVRELILKNCEKILGITGRVFSKSQDTFNCGINKSGSGASYADVAKNSDFLKQSFISHIDKNGIVTEMQLNSEEVLILKLAVLHNGGIVNLCGKTECIKILMNKGLIRPSNDGEYLVVSKVADVIIKSKKTIGYIMPDDELIKELKKDDKSKNIINICWSNIN